MFNTGRFAAMTAAMMIATAAALCSPSPVRAASTTGSEASLTDAQRVVARLPTKFVDGFNAHDGKAIGQLFTEDGEFIGITGSLWTGPAEITKVHSGLFTARYDQSAFTLDGTPSVDLLKPDIALIHWRWTISGVKDEAGAVIAPYSGIFTWVVVNQGGDWRVRAAHNIVTK